MNQFTKALTATLVFIALFTNLAAENNKLPTLDEIKRSHLEENSGYYSVGKLNSVFATGRIVNYSNDETIERSFRIYKKRPNKFRSFYETKNAQKIVQLEVIFDGDNAIQIFSHEGSEVYRENLQGDALEAVRLESKLEGPFLLVMEENEQYLKLDAIDYVEGEKCFLLRVDERSIYPYRNIWISSNNFQEVKFDRLKIIESGEQLEEIFYRNFKNVQGILLASRMDKFVNGKRVFTTFVDEFNVNYGLYDSLFDVNYK